MSPESYRWFVDAGELMWNLRDAHVPREAKQRVLDALCKGIPLNLGLMRPTEEGVDRIEAFQMLDADLDTYTQYVGWMGMWLTAGVLTRLTVFSHDTAIESLVPHDKIVLEYVNVC